nr:unnamed protein product [Haemonchus contortus]
MLHNFCRDRYISRRGAIGRKSAGSGYVRYWWAAFTTCNRHQRDWPTLCYPWSLANSVDIPLLFAITTWAFNELTFGTMYEELAPAGGPQRPKILLDCEKAAINAVNAELFDTFAKLRID